MDLPIVPFALLFTCLDFGCSTGCLIQIDYASRLARNRTEVHVTEDSSKMEIILMEFQRQI